MATDITDLVMLQYGIDCKNKELDRIEKEIASLKKELQRRCFHPTIKTTRDYYSGGYDYVSELYITETCVTCKQVLKHYRDPNHTGTHG